MPQETGPFNLNKGEESLVILHHVVSLSVPGITGKEIVDKELASTEVKIGFFFLQVGSSLKRKIRGHNRHICSYHD